MKVKSRAKRRPVPAQRVPDERFAELRKITDSGRRARDEGRGLEFHNPYAAGTPEYAEWRAGWLLRNAFLVHEAEERGRKDSIERQVREIHRSLDPGIRAEVLKQQL